MIELSFSISLVPIAFGASETELGLELGESANPRLGKSKITSGHSQTERERGKSRHRRPRILARCSASIVLFGLVACRDVRRFVLLALASTRSHGESWHESRFATGRSTARYESLRSQWWHQW